MNYGILKYKRGVDTQQLQNVAQERKLRTGCEICGWVDATLVEALQFNHIDPKNKLKQISNIWEIEDIADLNAEMDKCEVLCVNCHKRETLDQIDSNLYGK